MLNDKDRFLHPWMMRGRWYRCFIESDHANLLLTDSDIVSSLRGQYLIMPENFHIVDFKFDLHLDADKAFDFIKTMHGYADNRQAIKLPQPDQFDYGYVYVYGYVSNGKKG